MISEGLTDHQLCELLKDPQQNGHRTVEQIVHTPLVLWDWNPGDGRSPAPMSPGEFLAKVEEWAAKGAACRIGASAGVIPRDFVIHTSSSVNLVERATNR
jgi:hypothetical protein